MCCLVLLIPPLTVLSLCGGAAQNDGPVTIVVGNNFEKVVLDPTKDVLLEVRLPHSPGSSMGLYCTVQ